MQLISTKCALYPASGKLEEPEASSIAGFERRERASFNYSPSGGRPELYEHDIIKQLVARFCQ